jgi:thiol-disulfide isomerase/thioredoxin
MKLSQKDKSLLLLIAAALVVLWAIFSFFSSIFFAATFNNSDVKKLSVPQSEKWLNVSRPLEASDLKGHLILLDFWSYSCVSCIQTLPEIKKLEDQFGSKLTVIGVHSGQFANEKDLAAIKKAVLRYDISYPVINDSDLKIWNSFEVKALPTLILINTHGKVVQTYVGESDVEKIKADVKKLISKYKFQINRQPLPVLPEKYNSIGNVLSFPSKLEYAADFKYKKRQLPAIFISNSGQNNIVVSSLSGEIITKIGSGQKGLEDGSFDVASFNAPQGMTYKNGKLYVADFGNNAIREIDFKEGKVTTLVGLGLRGEIIERDSEAKDTNLAAPTDVKFFRENLAIANSGTHQILSYNFKNQTIAVLAGNGSKGVEDGKYPENSLAQTSGLSVFARKLYFVDAASSALRVLDESGEVQTLIGGNLTKSGHANGTKQSALMQHPLGLLVDDTGAYISDSYNHKIRKYDFSSKQISDLVGKKRGKNLGGANTTEFDEPEGIIAVLDRFYLADTNNNRILVLSRGNFSSESLNVMPPLKLPREGFLEYLPNLQKAEEAKVKDEAEIVIKIDLKDGWKINEEGPSFVNLLELSKDDKANLVASFDWNAVKEKTMKLPKLKSGKDYILQGSIYYCQNKQNALCYIKSIEQKIVVNSSESGLEILIKLGN